MTKCIHMLCKQHIDDAMQIIAIENIMNNHLCRMKKIEYTVYMYIIFFYKSKKIVVVTLLSFYIYKYIFKKKLLQRKQKC